MSENPFWQWKLEQNEDIKVDLMSKRNIGLIVLFLSISILTTSCGPRELTSEAYKFGKDTGAKWRDLADEFEVFSTWIQDETGEEVSVPDVEKKSACRAMWIAIGWPKFGLKDMSENRTDFVDGCLTTIGN